jgi:phosphate transport system substrate-binding protein
MKKILFVVVASLLLMGADIKAETITGAGATFPFPIYSKWSEAYKEKANIELNYQSMGSSGGVKQIKAGTVDFGATDAPLKADELTANGLIQFPAVLGGVVPVLNVEGIKPGELQLTGEVLAKIFVGHIVNWNDKRIQDLNPKLKLPDSTITIVHRADGSGTTFIFTDYLTEVSPLWKDEVGKGAAVKWPATTSVGGKGNEGVAANVSRIKNSIGYVEYAYAKKNKMTHVKLQNRDGKYVEPDDLTFASAASGADWFSVPGMGISLVNQKGAHSWPITGASFILMYREPKNAKTSQEVIKFFDWAFVNGGKLAADLDYVSLPKPVTDRIRSEVWSTIKK